MHGLEYPSIQLQFWRSLHVLFLMRTNCSEGKHSTKGKTNKNKWKKKQVSWRHHVSLVLKITSYLKFHKLWIHKSILENTDRLNRTRTRMVCFPLESVLGCSTCIFKKSRSLKIVAKEDTRGHLYTVNKGQCTTA